LIFRARAGSVPPMYAPRVILGGLLESRVLVGLGFADPYR